DFLHFGGPVDDSPALRDLVNSLNAAEGMRLGELAMRMVDTINQKFTYRQGVTTAASPITEALQHGWGVCQDFTHLLIGLARAMKIPARYVSGLLHPQAERFRGYTQTHAWWGLHFPVTGRLGLDPANRRERVHRHDRPRQHRHDARRTARRKAERRPRPFPSEVPDDHTTQERQHHRHAEEDSRPLHVVVPLADVAHRHRRRVRDGDR